MGYYADTTWNITFHSQKAVEAVEAELHEKFGRTSGEPLLVLIGENAEENWDGLTMTGWTSGKYFWDADDAIDIIAKHADGEVRIDASDSGDGYCKHILSGGTSRVIPGYIAYLDNRSPWDEIDGAPVADWQYEVANGDTRLGYLAWADAKIESPDGAASAVGRHPLH